MLCGETLTISENSIDRDNASSIGHDNEVDFLRYFDMDLIEKMFAESEDSGHIRSMSVLVDIGTRTVGNLDDYEINGRLETLRTRVSAARAREAVDGHGSLYVADHPLNKRWTDFAQRHPERAARLIKTLEKRRA